MIDELYGWSILQIEVDRFEIEITVNVEISFHSQFRSEFQLF